MDKMKEELARNAPQFLREHEQELVRKQKEDKKLANVSIGMENLKQDLAKKAPECVPMFEAAYRSLRAEEENESDESKMAKRLGGRNRNWNCEAKLSDFAIAVAAVKAGWCTAHSAYLAFKVPVKLLYSAIKEGRFTPFPVTLTRPSKKPKVKKSSGNQKDTTKRTVSKKLSKEDDNAVKDYALALYKIGFPPTYESFLPLAEKLYKKANSGIKSTDGWAFMFVKRHPDLYGKYLKRTQEHVPTEELTAQLFDRLNYLYETYGFATKPARIYACDALPFEAERWGAKKTTLVDAEILVAANAIGYHTITPCIVYADEDDTGIPDFLGLPEAGFVLSSEKKVTAPILAEWFSSVFVQYLPSRSAEDPILLLIDAKAEWFSPELLEAAEREHVHLVPICQGMRFAVNPIVNILLKLCSAYKDALDDYKRTRIARHYDETESQDNYFPVLLFDLFSDHFSMKQIQREFKSTGVYPLKPDIHLSDKQPSGSRENLASTTAAKDAKKAVPSDKIPSSTDGEGTKITSNTLPNSDGGSLTTVHNEDKAAVGALVNSTQKSATQTESATGSTNSSLNDRLSRRSREDEPIVTASIEELLGVPNTIPKEKPTIIVAEDPLKKAPAPTTSSDESSNVDDNTKSKESSSKGQEPLVVKKFDLSEMDSIVVVKNQNEDRRIYVKPKKKGSTPALKSTKTQPSATIAATPSAEFILFSSGSPSTPLVLKRMSLSNANAAAAGKDKSEGTLGSKSNRQGKTGVSYHQPVIMTTPTSTVGGRTSQHAANNATSAARSKITVVDVARGNKSALRKSPRKQVVVAREVLHDDGVDNLYDRRMSHKPTILGSRKRKLGVRKPPLVVTLDDLVVDKRPKVDLSVKGKRKKTEGASPSRKKTTRSMKR